MFESLTRRPLHPMQYLLVGLSLVLFYLVLLALSEHIGFTAAWLAASLSGAVMNGIYLQAVLRGWRNSLLFVAALLLLDGVMWFLLHSEDSAAAGYRGAGAGAERPDVFDPSRGLVCIIAAERHSASDTGCR